MGQGASATPVNTVEIDLKLFGGQRIHPVLAILIFHSPLVLHWALVRLVPIKLRTVVTLVIISLMITISLGLGTTEFLMSYCRVMAILFSMQLIRLIMDPRVDFLRTVSLKAYLLSVMSFGPVALPGALADDKTDSKLKQTDILFDLGVLLFKYAVVHAIHIFFYFFPYPLLPPVRKFISVSNVEEIATFYLLSVQLYMYMSIYFALSFGLYAYLCGRRAPSIFHAPLLSVSPREFWSRRWNMLFKQVRNRLERENKS